MYMCVCVCSMTTKARCFFALFVSGGFFCFFLPPLFFGFATLNVNVACT